MEIRSEAFYQFFAVFVSPVYSCKYAINIKDFPGRVTNETFEYFHNIGVGYAAILQQFMGFADDGL